MFGGHLNIKEKLGYSLPITQDIQRDGHILVPVRDSILKNKDGQPIRQRDGSLSRGESVYESKQLSNNLTKNSIMESEARINNLEIRLSGLLLMFDQFTEHSKVVNQHSKS